MIDATRQGWFQMGTSAENQLRQSTQELFHSGVLNSGEQILAMHAHTKEKLFIAAGHEFDDLEEHILVIERAVYGTRTPGGCWHDHLFEVLKEMGLNPYKEDPDVRMRPAEDHSCYEYIAVYVDEPYLQRPQRKLLMIKGTGPLTHHLGCTYTRDPDGTLVADPTKSIEKILDVRELDLAMCSHLQMVAR